MCTHLLNFVSLQHDDALCGFCKFRPQLLYHHLSLVPFFEIEKDIGSVDLPGLCALQAFRLHDVKYALPLTHPEPDDRLCL